MNPAPPDVEERALTDDAASSRRPEEHDFSEFFTATWARMYRTALAITRVPDQAEDAVQSAYASVYAHWATVQRSDHPEAYLRRAVVNEVRSTRRRAWWRRERPIDAVPEHSPEGSHEETAVARDELWDALQDLAPGQRAVLVLRYYEDLSEAEIARVLGVSRGTVKSQASAALAALRTKGIER